MFLFTMDGIFLPFALISALPAPDRFEDQTLRVGQTYNVDAELEWAGFYQYMVAFTGHHVLVGRGIRPVNFAVDQP